MKAKRKNYSAQFKVALDAARNEKTRSQLASEYEVHPTQVSQWKQALPANGSQLFDDRRTQRAAKAETQETAALYEPIGRLKMELEWLKKSWTGRLRRNSG